MILEFSFKSYSSTYTWNGRRTNDAACFSGGFPETNLKQKLTLHIPVKQQKGKSFCFCNEEQIKTYVSDLAKEFGFQICDITKNAGIYDVSVKFVNIKKRYGLLIATAIRYLYEWPYNVLCYAAIKNREKFPGLSLFTIVNYYIAKSDTSWCGHKVGDGYHSSRNIKGKSFYNLCCIEQSFNRGKQLCDVNRNVFNITGISRFNVKSIDAVAHVINKVITKAYEEDKESICCR